jgi:hypothetical protein
MIDDSSESDIQTAAGRVNRSGQTIRRWVKKGADVSNPRTLDEFARRVAARSFGRNGSIGARELGAKGGSKTSSAKKRSSRDNARLGGRPKTLATVARETFKCDAWQISEKNVVFNRFPSTEEWRLLFEYLRVSGNFFQVGSALAYRAAELRERYMQDKQLIDAKIAERQVTRHLKADISEFDDPEKALEASRVCAALGGKWLKLPWKYHRDAVAECWRDNAAEAITWLEKAEAGGWSVSELRAHIRRSHSAYARNGGATF